MVTIPEISKAIDTDISYFKAFNAKQKNFCRTAIVSAIILIASAIFASQLPFLLVASTIVVFSIAVISAVTMIINLIFLKIFKQKINDSISKLQNHILNLLNYSTENTEAPKITDPEKLKLIEKILMAGISPDFYSPRLISPLHHAVLANDEELATLLMDQRASLDNNIRELVKEKWQKEGETSKMANLLAKRWIFLQYTNRQSI